MPVKTCAELEKLTVCGLLAARKSKRALVRQLLEKKLLASQETVVYRQKMQIKLVAGTEHTRF